MRILILLTALLVACTSTAIPGTVSENNNDVLILSLLIQDHLRKTDGREINLAELLQADTLHRISTSFEKVEFKSKGGYISVAYKFAASRTSNKIVLSENEKERTAHVRWITKKLKSQYNGEIRIDYGERFYRLLKIVTNN